MTSVIPLAYRYLSPQHDATPLRQSGSRYDRVLCNLVRKLTRRQLPAAAALGEISENRANSPHSQLQLSKLFIVSAHLERYSTYLFKNCQLNSGSPYRAEKDGGIWRLVFNTLQQGDDATEEVVASVQGILCKNGLPPFLDQIG